MPAREWVHDASFLVRVHRRDLVVGPDAVRCRACRIPGFIDTETADRTTAHLSSGIWIPSALAARFKTIRDQGPIVSLVTGSPSCRASISAACAHASYSPSEVRVMRRLQSSGGWTGGRPRCLWLVFFAMFLCGQSKNRCGNAQPLLRSGFRIRMLVA